MIHLIPDSDTSLFATSEPDPIGGKEKNHWGSLGSWVEDGEDIKSDPWMKVEDNALHLNYEQRGSARAQTHGS